MSEDNLNPDVYATLIQRDLVPVEVLVTVQAAYQLIHHERYAHLSEVAEKLRIDKETLNRRIKQFEQAFPEVKVFEKQGRGRSRTVANRRAEPLFRDIDSLHRHWRQLCGKAQRHTIKIGASVSLHDYILGEVIREFRVQHPDFAKRTDIQCYSGQPQELRWRCILNGEFDFVVTSIADGHPDIPSSQAEIRSSPWKCFLLVPRGDPITQKRPLKWEDLNDWTIYVQAYDREPRPKVPVHRMPSSVRLIPSRSYVEVHSTIMGGGKNVGGFSFPQMLSPYQRELIAAVDIPDEVFEVRVGVVRPKKVKRRSTRAHNQIADALFDLFCRKIESLGNSFSTDRDFVGLNRFHCVFHETRDPGAKKNRWMAGYLCDLVEEPGGAIKATHVVLPDTGNELKYRVTGTVTRSPDAEKLHIIWSGHQIVPSQALPPDEYACTIIEPTSLLSSLGDTALTGTWHGRILWSDEFRPSSGYFILSDNLIESPKRLNKLAASFEQKHLPAGAPAQRRATGTIIGINCLRHWVKNSM